MKAQGNNYNKTIQIEFRDLIDNLLNSKRKSFNLYTIHRILSLSLLIDYDFRYAQVDGTGKYLEILLDLKEHGKVSFTVDMSNSCVEISNDISRKVLEDFLTKFDELKDRPKLFRKVF